MRSPIPFLIDRFFNKQPRVREWITKRLYGNVDLEIDLLGTPLRINSLRENGYLRAFRKCRTNSTLRDEIGPLLALANLMRPGDTFVDAGANIGLFCCTLARFTRWHPSLRILAFEPHPDTFQRLHRNAEACGVTAYNLALSSEEGELVFAEGGVSNAFAAADAHSPFVIPDRIKKVQAKRLDQIIPDCRSLVLKVDAEGHDLKVLQGAEVLFARNAVKAVFVDASHGEVDIEGFLQSRGFDLWDARTLQKAIPGGGILAVKKGT